MNFETTGNLFIEGDNLEVLKLLQKSYHERVKMIYIDPPYNTGNEFIYPDSNTSAAPCNCDMNKRIITFVYSFSCALTVKCHAPQTMAAAFSDSSRAGRIEYTEAALPEHPDTSLRCHRFTEATFIRSFS